MEKAVIIGDGWLLKIAVAEFDRVVGGKVLNLEASVVV